MQSHRIDRGLVAAGPSPPFALIKTGYKNGPMFNDLLVLPIIGWDIIDDIPCQQYFLATKDE